MSLTKLLTSLSSIGFALVLSGCGFQPMYAQPQDDSIASQLSDVKIDVIADRSGQILRNYMLDMMTENSSDSNKYLLKVKLSETIRKLGFRRDETARHEEIAIFANIQLENLETGKIEFTDSLKEVASFSSGPKADTASYSASVAEDSSRQMALKVLSDNINLRVSSYLISKESNEG